MRKRAEEMELRGEWHKGEWHETQKNIQETERFRKTMGFRKLERKERPCMYCSEAFFSQGIHNRLCSKCRAYRHE